MCSLVGNSLCSALLNGSIAEGIQTRQMDAVSEGLSGYSPASTLNCTGLLFLIEKLTYNLQRKLSVGFSQRWPVRIWAQIQFCNLFLCREHSYLVDPASSHMLVSKIKPCMSKYKQSIQWNCEWLIKSVIVYLIVPTYLDNRGNSRANTC